MEMIGVMAVGVLVLGAVLLVGLGYELGRASVFRIAAPVDEKAPDRREGGGEGRGRRVKADPTASPLAFSAAHEVAAVEEL